MIDVRELVGLTPRRPVSGTLRVHKIQDEGSLSRIAPKRERSALASRKWRLKNLERARAYARAYYARRKADPEYRAKQAQRVRAWEMENVDRRKAQNRLRQRRYRERLKAKAAALAR